MAMLELKNVHAHYGNIHALKDISIKVNKGEIVTLIGGNGAGKSTTLKAISGTLKNSIFLFIIKLPVISFIFISNFY